MNIKKIVLETIQNTLTSEFLEDEIINKKNISLEDEFDKYNNMFFNGELIRPPLGWYNKKRALGSVKVMKNVLTNEYKIAKLSISKFYDLTYNKFKNTLVHEMIHVKQLQDGELNSLDKHGFSFHRMANKINNMDKTFNITEKNTDPLSVSQEKAENIKPMILLILNIDGESNFSVINMNTYRNEFDSIIHLFKNLVYNRRKYNDVILSVYESKNPNLLKYRKIRSLRKGITYYDIKYENFMGDLKNDRLIKEIIISDKNTPKTNETKDNDHWVTTYII